MKRTILPLFISLGLVTVQASDLPRLELVFDAHIPPGGMHGNLFETRSKKRIDFYLPHDESAPPTRTVIVPEGVAGRCHLFLGYDPHQVGTQHFEVVCKVGQVTRVSVTQQRADITVNLPPKLMATAENGQYAVSIYHFDKQGLDPYFVFQQEVVGVDLKGKMLLPILGAVGGSYSLLLTPVDSDRPLYQMRFNLKGDWESITLSLTEEHRFDGIVAPMTTLRHYWWQTLWFVDKEGNASLLEDRSSVKK